MVLGHTTQESVQHRRREGYSELRQLLSRMRQCELQCQDIYSRFGIESTRR